MKNWKLKHPEYFKEYRNKNREKLDEQHNQWVKDNALNYKKYQRQYHKQYYKINKQNKMNEKAEALKAFLKASMLASEEA